MASGQNSFYQGEFRNTVTGERVYMLDVSEAADRDLMRAHDREMRKLHPQPGLAGLVVKVADAIEGSLDDLRERRKRSDFLQHQREHGDTLQRLNTYDEIRDAFGKWAERMENPERKRDRGW